MTMMTLAQAFGWISARIPQAQLVGADAGALPMVRVHTDTRTLAPGDLFVALKGERFDANAFLSQAREAGAVAAIAHRGLLDAGLPGVTVPDTLAALGALAAGWRSQFSLMLANASGIYGVYSYREVFEFKRFWSIGSGRSFALGAMHAVYARARSAREVAEAGIDAGCEFDRNSATPADVLTLKLKVSS